MNITLFDTTIGTTNLGDSIIQASIERSIQNIIDESFVIRFATHLQNFGISRSFFNFKVNFANQCDFKIIAGTNLLSSNVHKSFGQWQIGLFSTGLYKNSILFGVGTTYSRNKPSFYSKLIYKKILRKDFIHSVRDQRSLEFLESMGYSAVNTGCPTLWSLTPDFCKDIPSEKRPNVIISVSGYPEQRDANKDQLMIDQIEKLYDKKFLWVQTSEDEKYFDSLAHSSDYSKIYSLNGFSNVCKTYDVEYVGTRLHGGVFALQNGIRSLIIDHRAAGFHKSNNLNVLDRAEIANLTEILSNTIQTRIVLNEEAIDTFLKQFKI